MKGSQADIEIIKRTGGAQPRSWGRDAFTIAGVLGLGGAAVGR